MSGRPPIVIGTIRPRHLMPGPLLTLYRRALRTRAIGPDHPTALLWWSAAHAARRRAPDDPCRAWVAIVTARDWGALTDADEDRGRADLLAAKGRLRERETPRPAPGSPLIHRPEEPPRTLGETLDTLLP